MMLGRYELQEVIGVGSFATVHRATDTHLNDVVVVKVLAENHSLNAEVRERFIAEGRSLRKIDSPNVVRVHDIGESDRQQPYLVLSHADRGTLMARVKSLRSQGWEAMPADVLATARALATAMQAVHEAGLVHRDLSPGNVLLSTAPPAEPHWAAPSAVIQADERLVVADLGMCKDLALNSGLTVAAGTSGFRPPEQDGTGFVDARADLWAMSALMLWMCEDSRWLPPELYDALRRSSAADPADRHHNVAHWLGDIEAALAPPLQSEPLQSEPLQPEPLQPGSLQSGHEQPGAAAAVGDSAKGASGAKRSRRAISAGVGAALLVALAAFGVGWFTGPSAPSSSGGSSIAIEGPTEAGVGEPLILVATPIDVEHWVWTLPSGEVVTDEPTITLTPRSAGTAEVVLRARAPDGTDLEYVQRISVQE